jgi:hypothetical protein
MEYEGGTKREKERQKRGKEKEGRDQNLRNREERVVTRIYD